MENPDKDELIAYLDGELDPRTSQQVEERLKHDPAYRQALSQYERSWDMLDRLQRATVGENFSRTTLEMVSLAAAEEQQPLLRWGRLGRFSPRRIGIVALAAVAASLLGYAGGRAIWPDPNRELLQDLPILENLDLYEQAGSIDFLRKLAGTGLFLGAAGQVKVPSGMAAAESPGDRLTEIERMAPVEQEHLAHRQDRFFNRYSLAEKERLREIYRALNQGADGRQLREVLANYHEWLDTLLPSARDELDDLPDDERLVRVVQIKAEQESRRKKELDEAPTAQDLAAIISWFEDLSGQNRQTLLAPLSDKRRQYLEGLAEKPQRRALLWMWIAQHGGPGHLRLGQLTAIERDDLVVHLSPGARARLDAVQEPLEKKKLLSQWGQTAIRHQVETGQGGLRQFVPPINPGELERFSREELSAPQREALDALRYRKLTELMRLYFMSTDRLAEMKPEDITRSHARGFGAQGFPGQGFPGQGFPGQGAGRQGGGRQGGGRQGRPPGGPDRERGADQAPGAEHDAEKNPPAQ